MRPGLLALVAALVVPACVPAQAGTAPPPVPVAATSVTPPSPATGPVLSTATGAYSTAQAARGEAVFRKVCESCHVAADFEGDAFVSKFVGGTAFDMFETIRTEMPQDNPAGLPRAQYAEVVAYIFRLNGLPARAADLPVATDSLKAIMVEAAKPPPGSIHHQSRLRHGPTHLR